MFGPWWLCKRDSERVMKIKEKSREGSAKKRKKVLMKVDESVRDLVYVCRSGKERIGQTLRKLAVKYLRIVHILDATYYLEQILLREIEYLDRKTLLDVIHLLLQQCDKVEVIRSLAQSGIISLDGIRERIEDLIRYNHRLAEELRLLGAEFLLPRYAKEAMEKEEAI